MSDLNLLKQLNEFATGVAKAMNDAGVKTPGDSLAAVAILVGSPPDPPLACTLNWHDDHWAVDQMAQETLPC